MAVSRWFWYLLAAATRGGFFKSSVVRGADRSWRELLISVGLRWAVPQVLKKHRSNCAGSPFQKCAQAEVLRFRGSVDKTRVLAGRSRSSNKKRCFV